MNKYATGFLVSVMASSGVASADSRVSGNIGLNVDAKRIATVAKGSGSEVNTYVASLKNARIKGDATVNIQADRISNRSMGSGNYAEARLGTIDDSRVAGDAVINIKVGNVNNLVEGSGSSAVTELGAMAGSKAAGLKINLSLESVTTHTAGSGLNATTWVGTVR